VSGGLKDEAGAGTGAQGGPQGHGERQAEGPPGPLPTISTPKGGGAVRGIGEKFSVNAASGTGFEVRTYRLCRRVLLFHHFPAELGTADCLVNATHLIHDESPVATRMTGVTFSGYVRRDDARLPDLDHGHRRTAHRHERAQAGRCRRFLPDVVPGVTLTLARRRARAPGRGRALGRR
jgi:Salmonella virulence plasmid 65kDa B protein